MNKTNVMISGECLKLMQNVARWPCGVCGRGVGSYQKWVCNKCSGI